MGGEPVVGRTGIEPIILLAFMLGATALAACGGSTGQSPAPAATSQPPSLSAADRDYLSSVAGDFPKVTRALTTIQKESGRFASWTASDKQKVSAALATINVTYQTWSGQSAPSDAMAGLDIAWQKFLRFSHNFGAAYETGVNNLDGTKLNEAGQWLSKIQSAANDAHSQLTDAQSKYGL
jgi:hypothetical protein